MITLEQASFSGTPKAEVTVDAALVQQLLSQQHPDLAQLPIELLGVGWDNVMFRLGTRYTVRMPRRQAAVSLLENEQRCLPALAQKLPLPIPAPVRVGQPGQGYPWCWSVLPWFTGATVDESPLNAGAAIVLADFLNALHTEAGEDAPVNPVRGCPLTDRAANIAQRMQRLAQTPHGLRPEIVDAWHTALLAPISTPEVWLHGDLHARNVLADAGGISAIIDWGDITSGDPATDLASFWMLLPNQDARRTAWAHYQHSDPNTRLRALGWAILLGIVLLDSGLVDNPTHAKMGATTLANVLQDIVAPH